jgi:hypothetical protein
MCLTRRSRRSGCICGQPARRGATWRHGRFDDSEAAQEQLRVHTAARQGAIAAYGRICLRFGPESGVATLMPTWISSLTRLTSLSGLSGGVNRSILISNVTWIATAKAWWLRAIASFTQRTKCSLAVPADGAGDLTVKGPVSGKLGGTSMRPAYKPSGHRRYGTGGTCYFARVNHHSQGGEKRFLPVSCCPGRSAPCGSDCRTRPSRNPSATPAARTAAGTPGACPSGPGRAKPTGRCPRCRSPRDR